MQVNTGREPQKAGVSPEDADAFIAFCRDECALPIAGLMCIPPAGQQASPHFALLAQMAARNGLGSLSMGMSADYDLGVQLGATHVRVGCQRSSAPDHKRSYETMVIADLRLSLGRSRRMSSRLIATQPCVAS